MENSVRVNEYNKLVHTLFKTSARFVERPLLATTDIIA